MSITGLDDAETNTAVVPAVVPPASELVSSSLPQAPTQTSTLPCRSPGCGRPNLRVHRGYCSERCWRSNRPSAHASTPPTLPPLLPPLPQRGSFVGIDDAEDSLTALPAVVPPASEASAQSSLIASAVETPHRETLGSDAIRASAADPKPACMTTTADDDQQLRLPIATSDLSSDKRAARLLRFSQPPPPIVTISPDVGGTASCPIHILNLFAGIDNAGRTLTKLHFDFAKIVAHFELDEALASLLRAKGTAPVFADVNDIFSVVLPWFNCIFASPPCQPWSVRGEAKGVHDPRAATLPRIHQALLRFKPRGGVVEMVDGLRTWVSRGLHSSVATGPAFEEFASRVVAAGYVITSVSFPASRCRSMQSRLRLFMFTTRSDVVDALGPFTLPTLPQLQHQPIESLLRADPLSFDIIAPASSLVLLQKPSEFRQHLPHLLGYFEGSQVWAVSGLSPCILTDNRILFSFNDNLVELNLHGKCLVQGIDPASLPLDRVAACAAVGNSIDLKAHEFVLRHYLLYLKRACALPHYPASRSRVPFPGYDSFFGKALPPSLVTPSEISVPTVIHGDTATAALPGIDLNTAHIDDDPVIDWAKLQPLVDKHCTRWRLKATLLTKEMEAASRWDCSALPPLPVDAPFCHGNALHGCDYVRPCTPAVKAAVAVQRSAVFRTYTALASDSRSTAIVQILERVSAFAKRDRASSIPSSVSPTRQQWLEGQLQHLDAATSTPPGDLRRRQIQHLLRSGSPPTPSAAIPPTTPVSLRHPWAGFSRQLTAASIGSDFFSSEALSSMQAVYRWSIPTTASSDLRFGIKDYATADIVTARISCSPDDPLGPVARTFATIATVLAAQRPLVVAIFTPLAIWSSTQVGAVCSVKSFIDGLAGLDLKIKHISKPLDGCKVSIISPVEVASRLAFKESFDFSESIEFPKGPPLDYCIQQYLRPRCTFRVTDIEQVWPQTHRLAFAAWKAAELKRADSLRKGIKVPTPEVLILDEADLHPNARGIIWDLRAYWKALQYGKDDPSLIVPLCNIDALDTPFNHEAIRALTGFQQSPFPDLQTVHDMEFGFDNTAEPPRHSCFASNWPLSYQFYDIGNEDIKSYMLSGFVECCDAEGPAFIPSTAVGQNTVTKKDKDPTKIRRRVLDCSHPRGSVVVNGKLYLYLSLNSRIDVANQAEVDFSNFDRIALKAMSLARSGLPVRLFKTDGDAWYKQFFRRLSCVADGVASWPNFSQDPPFMQLFHDFRLQFGDASAAHRAYRVCYMTIWIVLRDTATRPAKNPEVRAWQKLQLELLESGVISETNLAYADLEGFIDDFMGLALAGEDWELLASLLGLMDLMGIKYSKKKTEAPHYKKVMLGFVLDMKRRIAYLEPEWRRRFIAELQIEVNSTEPVTLNNIQRLGGKSIRVCCIFPPLRAYCNGIFACLRAIKRKRSLSHAQQSLFRHDLGLILTTLGAAPSVHLLFEAVKVASIADGALHVDTDASKKWGMGAVLFTKDKAYYLYEEWTDEERAIFDIAELEAIAYDQAFKFFPAAVPAHFARKRMVGRIDSEVARFAFQGNSTSKGVINYCLAGVLRSQVRHHFHLFTVRVATTDNIFADDLSRGNLQGFLEALSHSGKQPIRLRLTADQRSTAAYAAVKAAFKAA